MPTATDTRQVILDVAQQIVARKGWSAVGLNEVLGAAGVPKGSFYHWFSSKDAFGQAMLQTYFTDYLAEMDALFADGSMPAADRLMAYWRNWQDTQSIDDCQGRCLAVKLGAEVADISEPMRLELKRGTSGIVERLQRMIEAGLVDGSLTDVGDPGETAKSLYEMWLGASVMAKIHRDPTSMDAALRATARVLNME